jgi:hypothetical protein
MQYAIASAVYFSGNTDIAAWIRNGAAHYINDKNSFSTFAAHLKRKCRMFRKETPEKKQEHCVVGNTIDWIIFY